MMFVFFLASVVLAIVVPSVHSDDDFFSCPDGWFGPHGYKCYKLADANPRRVIPNKVVLGCAFIGATAASIHSREENSYLSGQLRAAATDGAWIGLWDASYRYTGTWLDGSALAFQNFGASSRTNGTNDCVLLQPSGEWRTYSCSNYPNKVLCQWIPELETSLPCIEAKISALERQLNATDQGKADLVRQLDEAEQRNADLEHCNADLEAQTKLLNAILWALAVTFGIVVLLVILAFTFRPIKGAVMTWWRHRDGSGRMNLIVDA